MVYSQFISDVLELTQCSLDNVIRVDFMPASGVAWFDNGLKYPVFCDGACISLDTEVCEINSTYSSAIVSSRLDRTSLVAGYLGIVARFSLPGRNTIVRS